MFNRNRITAGRFKGRIIKVAGDEVFIPFGRERLHINREIVDNIKIMNVVQNRSFLSGFLRGYFADWWFDDNAALLAAVQSARGKSNYRIKITYRDGAASICDVEADVFDQLAVNFDIL